MTVDGLRIHDLMIMNYEIRLAKNLQLRTGLD